jgi:hypothetical protein
MSQNKFKKWVTGIAVGAVGVVGLSSLKNNDIENTQGLDEQTTANHTIDQADTNTISTEGANFNLDAENPEIVLTEKEPTLKDFAAEMERQIIHSFDYQDIQSLDSDERERVVNQIAKDYRACEKSVEISGEIDSELVGENNICSKYFDDKGQATLAARDVNSMAKLVMTENYAEILDGLPYNNQQQQLYDKLGPEFSKFYQADFEITKSKLSTNLSSAQNFFKDEMGDLSHLADNLESPEALEAQERLTEAKMAYTESYMLHLESQDLSDVDFLVHQNLKKASMHHARDLENYMKNYDINLATQVPSSLNKEYDDKVDFARQIRAAADKLGLNDDINMSYNIPTDTLTIEDADLEI